MGPCQPWIADPADLCGECLPQALDDEVGQGIVDKWGPVASTVLWGLTGRIYGGVCTDTVTPGRDGSCVQWLAYPGGGARPLVDAGQLPGCGSHAHGSILLPLRPVRRVVEVRVDGEVVDPDGYRLVNRRHLVRCGGSWPCWSEPCDDRLEITYEWGNRPPVGAAEMAGKLSCEYERACRPGCECRLPKAIQSVVQEGFTQSFFALDPMRLIDSGSVGLPEVDLWIHGLNPQRVQRPARMLSASQLVADRRVR
jgi:hypothetical protein